MVRLWSGLSPLPDESGDVTITSYSQGSSLGLIKRELESLNFLRYIGEYHQRGVARIDGRPLTTARYVWSPPHDSCAGTRVVLLVHDCHTPRQIRRLNSSTILFDGSCSGRREPEPQVVNHQLALTTGGGVEVLVDISPWVPGGHTTLLSIDPHYIARITRCGYLLTLESSRYESCPSQTPTWGSTGSGSMATPDRVVESPVGGTTPGVPTPPTTPGAELGPQPTVVPPVPPATGSTAPTRDYRYCTSPGVPCDPQSYIFPTSDWTSQSTLCTSNSWGTSGDTWGGVPPTVVVVDLDGLKSLISREVGETYETTLRSYIDGLQLAGIRLDESGLARYRAGPLLVDGVPYTRLPPLYTAGLRHEEVTTVVEKVPRPTGLTVASLGRNSLRRGCKVGIRGSTSQPLGWSSLYEISILRGRWCWLTNNETCSRSPNRRARITSYSNVEPGHRVLVGLEVHSLDHD